MTITDLLLPTYRNMLKVLLGLLDKAEAQLGADKAEALLSARLAPDMWPLAAQLRAAALQAQEAPRRLMGSPLDSLDPLLNEARNAGENPGTLAEARARLREALDAIDNLTADAFDTYRADSLDRVPADAPMALTLPMGLTFDLTREQFARDWALGQFYFHVMTAYAILRHHGVALGKADYVPHMMHYLRLDPAAAKEELLG